MARKVKKPYIRIRKPPKPDHCPICKDKGELDYKNVSLLAKFLTDRKKILPRSVSGVCAKHQRKLSYEIKKARQMALLPYTDQYAI